MNIFTMSEQEIMNQLEQLKRDVGFRDLRAKHRPRLMQKIEELEKRLLALKTMNKKVVQNLRALNNL